MKKIFALLLLLPFLALAGTVVDQGAGSQTQRPWGVTLKSSSGGPATAGAIVLSAGIPTVVSVSTVSAAATGLAANAQLRIVCNVDVYYRTGTGTPTAVTTDNDLPARVIEYIALPASTSATAIAFVTASGSGTCKVGIIPAS